MKKIFALLVAAVTISSVYAQDHSKERNADYGYKKYGNADTKNFASNSRERDAQIQRINREFDQQIKFVKKDRRLRVAEKNRQVSMLERQRDQKINEVIARFSPNKNGRYDDRYAKNDRRY